MKLEEMLQEIGLTPAEARVYLSLLDLKSATVGPIAKKANVSYSKVGILLDKLIDKGLCNYIMSQNVKKYSASNPKKILEYISEKKELLKAEEASAESLLPELLKKFSKEEEKERIEIYEGVEGLSTIYNEGLDELKDGEDVVVLGASFGAPSGREKVSRFFQKINQKRIKRKIKYRIIYNENLRNDPAVKEWQKLPYTDIRFLLNNTPGSINVRADRTMIIYWHKEKPKVFFIKSKPVADSFKQYFEVIWQQAKE